MKMSFAKPPIQEAIFDIRVRLPGDVKLENLANIQAKIKENFPVLEKRLQLQWDLKMDAGELPESMPLLSNEDAYIFKDPANQKVVQARLDGFSFSNINTYKDWEDFYENAYGLWNSYIETTHPEEVTRVALRYINRIEIPFENSLSLENYLNTIISLPEELPVLITESLMRAVVIHQGFSPSLGIISQVIQHTEEKNGKHILPVIFDIDVFQNVSLNPTQDETKIRNIFEENLRKFKNEIFFKSITSKTEELFK